MKLIQPWTLLVISVGALKRGKFGRMEHFYRHHSQSGSPTRNKLQDRHIQHLRPLPYGLKWPKKTEQHRKKVKQIRSLKKVARRLVCRDIECTSCITYYAFEAESPAEKTECPETTAASPDLNVNLMYGICCEHEF